MSIATVWFKAKLYYPLGMDDIDPEGLMRGSLALYIVRAISRSILPRKQLLTMLEAIGSSSFSRETSRWRTWKHGKRA